MVTFAAMSEIIKKILKLPFIVNSVKFRRNTFSISFLIMLMIFCNLISASGNNPDAPPWTYTNTGNNHTILILSTIPIEFNASPIDTGDYIGVFFDSLGTLACAGYLKWNNSNNAISAWGSDAGNDGFQSGEEFKWKIWRKSDNREYPAIATYNGDDFPNVGFFVANGMSGLESLKAYPFQDIDLPQGWSYFSTYIEPVEQGLTSLFNGIISNLNIMKDEDGKIYIPDVIDQINDVIIGKAYQVNMKLHSLMVVKGVSVNPSDISINLDKRVNDLGYLRQDKASVESLFHDQTSGISYIKDSYGALYLPGWGINTIGNLGPGKGYKIKTSDSLSYFYPSDTTVISVADTIFLPQPQRFIFIKNTGNNMILVIPKSAWAEEPGIGDEVGVHDLYGNIAGSAVYNGTDMAMLIWGDDDLTSERDGVQPDSAFILLYWHKTSNTIDSTIITAWRNGNNKYKADSLYVIDSIRIKKIVNPGPVNYYLGYNLVAHEMNFSIFIPTTAFISMDCYNLEGQYITGFISGQFEPGSYNLKIDCSPLSKGIYIFRLQIDQQVISRKMLIY
ncbi:MAG: hypothetical protein NTW49_02810 [Bacteroidia bacterium]|nr:hypothetical protein [Bacteroidia bacterium]